MSSSKLDNQEKEILDAYEAGELVSILEEQGREYYAKIADETLKRNRRIDVHISEQDLKALRQIAVEKGLPCELLAASILHKYASGDLKDCAIERHPENVGDSEY